MVNESNFEVRSDLWVFFEVTMASEATKIACRSSMHMDIRVIWPLSTILRSEVTSEEVTVASKADRIAFRGNMHMVIRVIYASDFKFEAQFAVRDHQDHHHNSRVLRAIALLYE